MIFDKKKGSKQYFCGFHIPYLQPFCELKISYLTGATVTAKLYVYTLQKCLAKNVNSNQAPVILVNYVKL